MVNFIWRYPNASWPIITDTSCQSILLTYTYSWEINDTPKFQYINPFSCSFHEVNGLALLFGLQNFLPDKEKMIHP